jgi:hypothetical protein
MQQEAASLAVPRVFHLDDIGAEPGERLGAGGAGLELAQVENADAGKATWTRAVGSHCFVAPGRNGFGVSLKRSAPVHLLLLVTA